MKTLIDGSLIVNLKPNVIKDDDEGVMGANFKWGLFGKPEIVEKNDDGIIVFCPNNSDLVKDSLQDVHIMRLFCIHIVQQMIKNKESIDQDFYTKINFELTDEIKDFISNVLGTLEIKVLEEIFYLNNPIKPIKTEIKKIPF